MLYKAAGAELVTYAPIYTLTSSKKEMGCEQLFCAIKRILH